jgi:hypothetical protein
MNTYEEVEIKLNPFLTSILVACSDQRHAPAAVLPGKAHTTRWIGDYLGPRTDLGTVKREKNLLPLPTIGLNSSVLQPRTIVILQYISIACKTLVTSLGELKHRIVGAIESYTVNAGERLEGN